MSLTNDKVAAVLSALVNLVGLRELSLRERRSAETLITLQIHQQDVFDHLVRTKVTDPTDFVWLIQVLCHAALDGPQQRRRSAS